MVDVQDFLEQVIEGYLFHDLENMAAIPREQHPGACGFPMVQSCLAGIELLGGLLGPAPFNAFNGRDYFLLYWKRALSRSRTGVYAGLGDAVYSLARNGIGHQFITKPGIEIRKGEPDYHMRFFRQERILTIDCVQLYKDLEASYWTTVRPIVDGKAATVDGRRVTRRTMQVQLDEMETKYEKQAATALKGEPEPPARRPRLGTYIGGIQFMREQSSPSPDGSTVVFTTQIASYRPR
jgi:hypothetical protein